jgi:hypothetical protein
MIKFRNIKNWNPFHFVKLLRDGLDAKKREDEAKKEKANEKLRRAEDEGRFYRKIKSYCLQQMRHEISICYCFIEQHDILVYRINMNRKTRDALRILEPKLFDTKASDKRERIWNAKVFTDNTLKNGEFVLQIEPNIEADEDIYDRTKYYENEDGIRK